MGHRVAVAQTAICSTGTHTYVYTHPFDVQASKMYQVCGLRSGGIAAATAGLVGPAFMIMHSGPGEFNGAQLILPLGKGIDVAGQDNIELAKAGMLTPQFRGGQAFNYRLYGFTAEQPQGEILFFASQP